MHCVCVSTVLQVPQQNIYIYIYIAKHKESFVVTLFSEEYDLNIIY